MSHETREERVRRDVEKERGDIGKTNRNIKRRVLVLEWEKRYSLAQNRSLATGRIGKYGIGVDVFLLDDCGSLQLGGGEDFLAELTRRWD
ncbi:hypothetical protein KQX54_006159 [Cotesia glomerata]|uniref:Uncharacterized protein n=1 Tax=Cotesia glomerata TaxID=32391 RepID=A0AAV7I7N3_COTGL|nr:hypothetical protein KQX54_006159 [Cotesia glomerata]